MMRMISYHINARSRMTPETVKALVCLQDWIRATGMYCRFSLDSCSKLHTQTSCPTENLILFCAANTRRPMDSVHDIIMALEGIVVCRVFS